MSSLTRLYCGSLLFCHLLTGSAQAQSVPSDSLPAGARAAYDTALDQYHTYLAPESGLYRGNEYASYEYQLRSGHPYFDDNRRHMGTVHYDGVQYNNVLLQYDEVTDQVLLYDVNSLFRIALYSDLIDRFTFDAHRFIRLKDSLNPTQPHNGFYEVLYQGRISLLKKEKKAIQEDLYSSSHVERYIAGADTSYYLKKGDVYYPVRNTKTLLRALKDRSKDVKKFIRTSGLSMRKDRENTLIKVVAWYDTSSPQ